MKQNVVPYPGSMTIDGQPLRSGSGASDLEFQEDGAASSGAGGNSPRLKTVNLNLPAAASIA